MERSKLKHKSHDHFFRAMMSNVELAKDFFTRHLPIEVQQLIDFSSLHFCKETYVDEELRLSEVDVLYSVNFFDQPGYLYVLAEHQSTVDHSMSFRLLKYMVKIMDHHLKTHRKAVGGIKLPVIYPMVFYHGSLDLFELFGEHHDLAKSIFLQPFKLIDVGQVPDSELQTSYLSGTMEFIFKHILKREILEYLEQIKEPLQILDIKYS
jgi:predicted transposase/invertase (TIGR01784 family)